MAAGVAFCYASTARAEAVVESVKESIRNGSLAEALDKLGYDLVKRTNASPTISFRGHVLHASVGIDGTVSLVAVREDRMRRIE